MNAIYFYVKWDNLLEDILDAENSLSKRYANDDILLPIYEVIEEKKLEMELLYDDYIQKKTFSPISIEGYDWIKLIQIPSNLSVYSRALSVDENLYQNISNLSQEDTEAINFIRELTFGFWGPSDEIFENMVFKDFSIELYKHICKIYANKTLSPVMIQLVLEKWNNHKFYEKMNLFGPENSLERTFVRLWMELLETTKASGWGLLYHWY